MTPAHFDTYRRSLGLSTREVAALCGVQDRTVNRWQSGVTPIPEDAKETLEALEDAMLGAVEQAVSLATDKTMQGPVILWRYKTQSEQDKSEHATNLPLGAHAVMIAWAHDAISAQGIDCSIEWASPAPQKTP